MLLSSSFTSIFVNGSSITAANLITIESKRDKPKINCTKRLPKQNDNNWNKINGELCHITTTRYRVVRAFSSFIIVRVN